MFPSVQYLNGNIPVIYTYIDESPGLDDYMPSYLSCRPVVGDIVESYEQRRFEIKEITHILDGRKAALRLEVGKPTGGQSEISGMGANPDGYF